MKYMESSVELTNFCDKEKIFLHTGETAKFQLKVFRTMDEEDSMDGMEDEESKNPLAFLGLQRSLFLSAEVVTMSACVSFYFKHLFSQGWF